MGIRKETEEKIKETLINTFGYSEFKAKWDELSQLLELPIDSTKYYIHKLAYYYGFLKIIEESEMNEGYVSPNVIIIFNEEKILENVPSCKSEYFWMDIQDYFSILEEQTKNAFEEINKPKLTKEDNLIYEFQKRINYLYTKQNEVFAEIKKSLSVLDKELTRIQVYKDEIRKLNREKEILESESKKLFQQTIELRERINELRFQN